MQTLASRKILALAGLAGLSMLFGCVGSGENASEDTEEAYALRSELSGSADSKKTYVCHIPPGNPANAHTIHVGNAAVDAHLAHGDSLGQCDSVLAPPDSLRCKNGKGGSKKKSIQNVITQDGKSWKVTICHMPPGNPDNGHTISVGSPAVRAHLAHGDVLGACGSSDGVLGAIVKDCPDTGTDTTGTGGDTTTGPGPGTGDTGTNNNGGTTTGPGPGTGTDTGTPADNT